MIETYIGGVAAVVGISISLPQIHKTYKTKKVKDISHSMWALLLLGQLLWLTYALIRGDIILAIANIITAFQSSVMLYLIYNHKG